MIIQTKRSLRFFMTKQNHPKSWIIFRLYHDTKISLVEQCLLSKRKFL